MFKIMILIFSFSFNYFKSDMLADFVTSCYFSLL